MAIVRSPSRAVPWRSRTAPCSGPCRASRGVFHVVHSLALDGAGVYELGSAVFGGPYLVEGVQDLGHVVAVYVVDVEAEVRGLLRHVESRHDLVCRAVELQTVVVEEHDVIVELILVRAHHGLPDDALVYLAVSDHGEHAVVLPVALAGESHAHCAGRALAQRAGGDVYAGAFHHARVALEHGALLPERVQHALGEVAQQTERGVEDGADVALREHEAVPVLPAGVFGVYAHLGEIQGRDHIRCGERAARVAGLRLVDHGDGGLAQLLCPLLEHRYLFLIHGVRSFQSVQ